MGCSSVIVAVYIGSSGIAVALAIGGAIATYVEPKNKKYIPLPTPHIDHERVKTHLKTLYITCILVTLGCWEWTEHNAGPAGLDILVEEAEAAIEMAELLI